MAALLELVIGVIPSGAFRPTMRETRRSSAVLASVLNLVG
jgi:hypothetical protein